MGRGGHCLDGADDLACRPERLPDVHLTDRGHPEDRAEAVSHQALDHARRAGRRLRGRQSAGDQRTQLRRRRVAGESTLHGRDQNRGRTALRLGRRIGAERPTARLAEPRRHGHEGPAGGAKPQEGFTADRAEVP